MFEYRNAHAQLNTDLIEHAHFYTQACKKKLINIKTIDEQTLLHL